MENLTKQIFKESECILDLAAKQYSVNDVLYLGGVQYNILDVLKKHIRLWRIGTDKIFTVNKYECGTTYSYHKTKQQPLKRIIRSVTYDYGELVTVENYKFTEEGSLMMPTKRGYNISSYQINYWD